MCWWCTTPPPATRRLWRTTSPRPPAATSSKSLRRSPTPDDDLNWTDENSRVSREHADESLRDVELTTTEVENWDSYDTVFIGYPIWWGIAAWPVDGFVEANDFTGKDGHPLLHLLQLRPGPEWGAAGRAGRHRRLAGGAAVPLQRQPGGCKRVGGQPGAVRTVTKRQGAGAEAPAPACLRS